MLHNVRQYKGIKGITRLSTAIRQIDFSSTSRCSFSPSVTSAINALSAQAGAEARGAVFTRSEVVEFVLDLSGYTPDRPLFQKRLLEPSFGGGDFLLPAIERLLTSWRAMNKPQSAVPLLGDAIRAVELHYDSFTSTRAIIISRLEREQITTHDAQTIVDRWISPGDFLLSSFDSTFDFVVGNPPYVRQELIPAALLAEYRRLYSTLYDRADLYIPFIERSLRLLSHSGTLGFICADRWMKNRYGGPLRKLVAEKFHLKIYVDMVDTAAFHSDVIAYPAITVITSEKSGPTRVAHRPQIDQKTLKALSQRLRAKHLPTTSGQVLEISRVPAGSEPWLLGSADQTALIRRLENRFPTLEEAGCKVGIGVATGADKAFIGNFDLLNVEDDRKLPLATTRDIVSGEVRWSGQGVLNPFAADGRLVDLQKYPRLAQYLEKHKKLIAGRHCATKAPANWYRTIDRIWPALAEVPKLLIPDIKGEANIVFEPGKLYPHHNLYYITSDEWDLRALQAILLSGVARLFVATYSTQMHGGYLRFQAQYLRRIRIPQWADVPADARKQLVKAAKSRDLVACSRVTFNLYDLSQEERASLGGNGE